MGDSAVGFKPINSNLKRDIYLRYSDIVRTDVPLSEISRWKIGGLADILITPRTPEEIANVRAWLYERNVPSVVIGATSNLLFSDKGLQVVAIQVGSALSKFDVDYSSILVQAGVWVPGLARKAMKLGLSGLEHTCGIPGTLGGLVCMNGGSQRKGIGSNVISVCSINAKGEMISRTTDECKFNYRSSIFQKLDEIIVDVQLQLDSTIDRGVIRRNMLKILKDRRKKFPQKQPNCGSVFVSNPSMYEVVGPPGRVIEACGYKGVSCGAAQVSNMHANFIVNNGGAKADEVLSLIRVIGKTVMEKTGFIMEVEAKFVSPQGEIQNITFV